MTCPLRSRGGADSAVVPPRWWVVPVWGGVCCLSGPVLSVWVSGDLPGHGRETAAVRGRGEGGGVGVGPRPRWRCPCVLVRAWLLVRVCCGFLVRARVREEG